MINTEENKVTFVSKTFHWWPFYGLKQSGLWRGFIERNDITITDTEITFSYNNGKEKSLPVKDLAKTLYI